MLEWFFLTHDKTTYVVVGRLKDLRFKTFAFDEKWYFTRCK